MIFHILPNPSVPSNLESSGCAFTQLSFRLSRMFRKGGKNRDKNIVYYYGTIEQPDMETFCDHYVTVLKSEDYSDLLNENVNFNSSEYLSHKLPPHIDKLKLELMDKYFINFNNYIIDILNNSPCHQHTIVVCYQPFTYEYNEVLLTNFKNCNIIFSTSMGGTYIMEPAVFCSQTFIDDYRDIFFCKKYNEKVKYNFTPDNHTVIPPLFDIIPQRPLDKRDYYLYLGRIDTGKGVDTIFKLAKMNPDKKFKIAGQAKVENNKLQVYDLSGEYKPISKNGYIYFDLEEFPNVEFVGFVTDKKHDLLRNAIALIQPSAYREPFGFNVIEAYLQSTPVITSNWGTFLETVTEDTGIRCNDIEEYSTALTDILRIDNSKCLAQGLKYTDDEECYRLHLEFIKRVNKNLSN